MTTKYVLRDTEGMFYADCGLDTTDEISRSMKFETEADATRVMRNLGARFIYPFEMVTVISHPIGKHGEQWRVAACEQCGMFEAEMEDPTFGAGRALPGARALRVCEHCAKCNIEGEMLRLGKR